MNAQVNIHPPQDETAEISVLALLMATGQPYRVTDKISADDFFNLKHQTIFRAILSLPIDKPIDTNRTELACKRIDPDWDDWTLIREIQSQSKRWHALSENMEDYASAVLDSSLRRQYLATISSIGDGIHNNDMNGMSVDVYVESKMQALSEKAQLVESEWMEPYQADEFEDMMKPVVAVSTGFADIDRYTNGLCAPDLFVLTGLSGSGKTTLAMNMVRNMCNRGGVCALFSMEMSRKQVLHRYLASAARVQLDKVQAMDKHPEIHRQIEQAYTKLCSMGNMYVGDRDGLTMSQIKSKAHKIKHKHGKLDVVVVDYLTRGRPDDMDGSRNNQVGQMARSLKSIAKQLDCCVLVLAQLNRQKDIRDSGEVNHEADVILHIDVDEVQQSKRILTTKKSRHTQPGTFNMTFEGEFNQFTSYIETNSYRDLGQGY